jgi:hypothetical protein
MMRTYICKEEKTMTGLNAAEDRRTLLLWGNADGGQKFKLSCTKEHKQGYPFSLLLIKPKDLDYKSPFLKAGL